MSGTLELWRARLRDSRVIAAAVGGGAVLLLGGAGLAAASAVRAQPEVAAEGRLTVAYEVRRAPPYVPPPASEETRLDVRPAASFYQPVAEVSPEADAAWQATKADDARRMAVALAEIRAADRRADRELAAQLRAERWASASEPPAAFVYQVRDGDPPELAEGEDAPAEEPGV